jgi:hypothetical protein
VRIQISSSPYNTKDLIKRINSVVKGRTYIKGGGPLDKDKSKKGKHLDKDV